MTRTKLTVDITIETQFGPSSAISVIQNALKVPAITNAELVRLETDFKFPEKVYSENVDLLAVKQIPFTLK